MNGLSTALRAELFVGLRSFSSKLIVLAPSLLVLLQYAVVRLGEVGQQTRDNLLGSSSFDDAIATNAYGYFVDGLTTGLTMLALLLVAQAAYSFSYERDVGIVRHVLIRGASRGGLIAAKLIHLHLLALLSIAVLLFVSYSFSALFWDYAAIVEDGFELIGEAEMRQEIWLGLRLAIMPLPAAIGFGVLISVCSQSATQAVATAIGITLAIDVFKSMLGDFSNYLYASFQPSLIDQSYLQDVSRIVRGYSDVLIDDRIIQLNMWVPLPALVIFFAAAVFIINRRNI